MSSDVPVQVQIPNQCPMRSCPRCDVSLCSGCVCRKCLRCRAPYLDGTREMVKERDKKMKR